MSNDKNKKKKKDAGNKNRPAGWSKKSHSNEVDPDYDVVFPKDVVNSITITLSPEDWAAMQSDMEEIYADSLPIREAILAAGGTALSLDERAAIAMQTMKSLASAKASDTSSNTTHAVATETTSPKDKPEVAYPYKGVKVPQIDDTGIVMPKKPMWVPATVTFKDQEWPHMGIRYKGISSLGVWATGESQLPFKLKFDRFEDYHPEIKNQRFFGFQELSLANNYSDPAGMRDALVYDLLEEAGLPSLQTAAYEVYLDHGEGPTLLGLYTMIEIVEDTGVRAFFGSDNGNLYEGDGRGASLSTEYADKIVASFPKKNNEKEADWSDIWALYETLHDERRISDPEAWRADLEAIFDVDAFLGWLAIRGIVGHADSYGNAPHNFFLYHNPRTGQLTWFSWDHNLTFIIEGLPNVPLEKPSDKEKAPLIGFLLDDPIYYARYRDRLARTFAGVAAPEAVLAKVRAYAKLIAPYATKHMTQAEYGDAVQKIVDFVTLRATQVEAFLATQA